MLKLREIQIRSILSQIGLLLILSSILWQADAEAPAKHERLRFRNDFNDPQQVVRYYVSRDASGFVWSGFLTVERKAFTNWKRSPANDSFFVAKDYRIGKSKIENSSKATVTVEYKILGMSDAHGTMTAAPTQSRVVTFHLSKSQGQWKIDQPAAEEIAPVVLVSLVPYVGQQ